jgi:hypothetical protein
MFNITGRGTVFQVEDKGNYIQANLSTGKKKQDGTYENMNWRTRFVGNCKQAAAELTDKTRIEIKSGVVENSYNKETKTLYVNVAVFAFDVLEQGEKKQELPTDFVPIDDDSDLPF